MDSILASETLEIVAKLTESTSTTHLVRNDKMNWSTILSFFVPPAGLHQTRAWLAVLPTLTPLTFRAHSASDGTTGDEGCERNVRCECDAGYRLNAAGTHPCEGIVHVIIVAVVSLILLQFALLERMILWMMTKKLVSIVQ